MISHAALVELAAKWLRKKHAVVITEHGKIFKHRT